MQIKNIEGLRVSEIQQLVQQGGKFVVFPYTISIILATFKRSSDIYFIRPGEGTIKYSIGFVLLNFIMGWWGIPWGPIYTLGAIGSHISGGKKVTQEVLSELIQNDPEANTSTYNINGNVSSNTASNENAYGINNMSNSSNTDSNNTDSNASDYNIPR
ncbi:hypothetical protein [Aquimarina longa]|uniref:hypothetical protein n=1 Tax=Aquimarina longa TaxID=1080221 RepID=UPI0007808CB3|nr:hypothetical protein [Aquimarina longa]